METYINYGHLHLDFIAIMLKVQHLAARRVESENITGIQIVETAGEFPYAREDTTGTSGAQTGTEPSEQMGKKIAVIPAEIFSNNFGDKQRLFADNYS